MGRDCRRPGWAVTQRRGGRGDSSQSPRQPSLVYLILIFIATLQMSKIQTHLGGRGAVQAEPWGCSAGWGRGGQVRPRRAIGPPGSPVHACGLGRDPGTLRGRPPGVFRTGPGFWVPRPALRPVGLLRPLPRPELSCRHPGVATTALCQGPARPLLGKLEQGAPGSAPARGPGAPRAGSGPCDSRPCSPRTLRPPPPWHLCVCPGRPVQYCARGRGVDRTRRTRPRLHGAHRPAGRPNTRQVKACDLSHLPLGRARGRGAPLGGFREQGQQMEARSQGPRCKCLGSRGSRGRTLGPLALARPPLMLALP